MLKSAHVLAFALLLLACLAQDGPAGAQANEVTQMDGPVLAEEAKEEEKLKAEIPDFIIAEFKELKTNRETFNEVESFLASIPSAGTYEFKYKIQSNPNPGMIIELYTQENGEDISIIKQADRDIYLQVSVSTNLFGTFTPVGKVHSRKFVRFGSFSGSELFVRVESKFERSLVAEIALSGPPAKLDRDSLIKNDNFTVMTKKLVAIQQEMKAVEDANRFKFKFEWGFLEREEHYEEQMLKLTGVEAFVILATSVVQIYCIKSLFDKNGIV